MVVSPGDGGIAPPENHFAVNRALMITLQNVTYTYPGTKLPALQDLSLSIPEGQFCVIVGPNGAGKSTLAYILSGFIPHFYQGLLQGEVTVAGKNTRATPLFEMVRYAGLILQNPFNQISGTKVTVREEIAFGLENLGIPREEMIERIEAVMDLVGIRSLAERYPLTLSGGQMQRLAIASVLVMRPQVLLLDEPTSQLDPIGSRYVFETVRKLASSGEMTVVMVEHKLEWVAEYADRVIALSAGRLLADGEPSRLFAAEDLVQHGIGQTRYTQVARLARQRNVWPEDTQLPVTLQEAARGFRLLKTRG